MSSMRQRWSSVAASVMTGAFAVFSVLLIEDAQIDKLHRRHAEQLSQLEVSSTAAEDRPSAVEPFRSDVGLSDTQPLPAGVLSDANASATNPAAYQNRLRRLDAQNRKIEIKLAAATQRLKLLEAQRTELDRYLARRSYWTSLAMLVCVVAYLLYRIWAQEHVARR